MSESQETTEARIIKHMNTDHSESLSLFLQHYRQVSAQKANGAAIYEISLSAMNLRTSDSDIYSVPFEPPMESLANVRERMVEMDRIVRKALGVPNVRLTRYLPPTSSLHISIFGACLFTFVTFSMARKGDLIVPGTFYYDKVLRHFPGGAKMFLWCVSKITLPVIGIHALESWYLDRTRLRPYGVKRGTKLWWCWMTSCFIEGFGCFKRIDAEIKKLNLTANKKKH